MAYAPDFDANKLVFCPAIALSPIQLWLSDHAQRVLCQLHIVSSKAYHGTLLDCTIASSYAHLVVF